MAHAQAWHPCVTPHSHQRTRHRPSCCGRASLCGNPYMCAGLPFQHHRPQLCHIGTAGDAKPTTTHCTVVHSHCRRQRGQTPWWHVKAKAHSHVCRHRCVMRVSVVFRVGLARMFCSDRCTLKVQRKQRHVSAEHSLLAKKRDLRVRAFVLRTETCSKCPSTYRAKSTRLHAQAVQHHYPNGICTVASTCSQRGINVRTSNSNAFRCNLRIQMQPRAVVRKNATLELLVKVISRNRTKKNGDCMANCVQTKT